MFDITSPGEAWLFSQLLNHSVILYCVRNQMSLRITTCFFPTAIAYLPCSYLIYFLLNDYMLSFTAQVLLFNWYIVSFEIFLRSISWFPRSFDWLEVVPYLNFSSLHTLERFVGFPVQCHIFGIVLRYGNCYLFANSNYHISPGFRPATVFWCKDKTEWLIFLFNEYYLFENLWSLVIIQLMWLCRL